MDITDNEFERIKKVMYKHSGVRLKPSKKPLVVSRLRKRLLELGLQNFGGYADLIEQNHSPEMEYFLNALTTNETFMFRHNVQFDILKDVILPEIVLKKRPGQKVRILSAACSTGEEPYTLALVCEDFFSKHAGRSYELFAADINSDVLSTAKQGLYNERSVKEVPALMKSKYFTEIEKGEHFKRKLYQLDKKIIHKVHFMKHNLQTPFRQGEMDIVFLRNVMIYFDKDSKQKVVSNLERVVASDGYMVISLAETLSDVNSSFNFFKSGIYKKGMLK